MSFNPTSRFSQTQSASVIYDFNGDNNCAYPARVRFRLQESGDDLPGTKGKQYFRRWSNRTAYQPAAGAVQLRASLTDLRGWTSVIGEKANAIAAAAAGFRQAIGNLGNVGFSFDGGCFYGHGVRVSGGGAKFVVDNYIRK
jgi:hypothetical protein